MNRILSFVSLTAFTLARAACGSAGSKGEDRAKQLGDCHTSAGSDVGKKAECVSKQVELQKQIEGNPMETNKYLQKFSQCKAAFGG